MLDRYGSTHLPKTCLALQHATCTVMTQMVFFLKFVARQEGGDVVYNFSSRLLPEGRLTMLIQARNPLAACDSSKKQQL